MPTTDRRPTPEEVEAAEAEADLEAWPAGFARSQKGNLWRRLDDGVRLTVLRSKFGGYTWVLNDDNDPSPEWSPDTYRTERAAVEGAWWAMRERYT